MSHVVHFEPCPGEPERCIVVCECTWRSRPVNRVSPVNGGPTAASVAYVHTTLATIADEARERNLREGEALRRMVDEEEPR